MKNLFALLFCLLSNRTAGETGNVDIQQHIVLLKFDDGFPAVGELKEPLQIMEGNDESTMQITYIKGNGDIKLYTGDGTGGAKLAEVNAQ